jgi:hypothetical protein
MRVAQPSNMMQIAVCVGRYHGLSCSRSRLLHQIAVSRPGWRTGKRGSCYCNTMKRVLSMFQPVAQSDFGNIWREWIGILGRIYLFVQALCKERFPNANKNLWQEKFTIFGLISGENWRVIESQRSSASADCMYARTSWYFGLLSVTADYETSVRERSTIHVQWR